MRKLVEVDAFRCKMWDLHDRLEACVTEASCKAELDSFTTHGQLVPVLGRALPGDSRFDVELIYGARRLFVARQLNAMLLVDLRAMSDKDAIIAMDIENRQRVDISPYERGISYASWLRDGHFSSQEELARALKISASQVSRLLKLAHLPTVVVNAFRAPTEICEGWALRIYAALENLATKERVLKAARVIASSDPKPPGEDVYRRLLAESGRGKRASHPDHDEVVHDDKGHPLFRIRHQRAAIALVVPMERVSSKTLVGLRAAVAGVLAKTSAVNSNSEHPVP